VSPVHFDFKTYTDEYHLNGEDHAYSVPVYFRKAYEMRPCVEDDGKYHVREMEVTE
jgi:hypothetical protein